MPFLGPTLPELALPTTHSLRSASALPGGGRSASDARAIDTPGQGGIAGPTIPPCLQHGEGSRCRLNRCLSAAFPRDAARLRGVLRARAPRGPTLLYSAAHHRGATIAHAACAQHRAHLFQSVSTTTQTDRGSRWPPSERPLKSRSWLRGYPLRSSDPSRLGSEGGL